MFKNGGLRCCFRRRRRATPSAAWSSRPVCRRLDVSAAWRPLVWVGVSRLEAAAVLVCVSEKTQVGYAAEPPQAARPHCRRLCSAKAGSSQEPLGAEAQPPHQPHTAHASGTIFWRLLDVFTKRLHGCERRLAAIGGELRRIRAPVCRVMEEAGALLKKSSTWRGPPV